VTNHKSHNAIDFSAFADPFMTAPPDVVPTSGRAHPLLSKGMSEASYGSDSIDLSALDLQVRSTIHQSPH